MLRPNDTRGGLPLNGPLTPKRGHAPLAETGCDQHLSTGSLAGVVEGAAARRLVIPWVHMCGSACTLSPEGIRDPMQRAAACVSVVVVVVVVSYNGHYHISR